MADPSENVRAEQFWFSLTTLGVNGSLIANAAQQAPAPFFHWIVAIVFSTLLSSFAAYLILERSAFLVHGAMLPPIFRRMETLWPGRTRSASFATSSRS
jgi:hypothetical protein